MNGRELLARWAGGPGSGIKGHRTAKKLHEKAARAHIAATRGQMRPEDALAASQAAHDETHGIVESDLAAKGIGHDDAKQALTQAQDALHSHKMGWKGAMNRGDLANSHEKAALTHMHAAQTHDDAHYNSKVFDPKKKRPAPQKPFRVKLGGD